jgi:phage terminase large subunit GpA-like protein
MWASQTGKTRIQMNAIGYYSHHDPSPIMIIQFSLDEAEKFSKNRIAKMIRDTPVLKRLFKDPRARDSGNTLLNKEFPGGVLTIAGANSPAGLASKPIRILITDEVDRYPESAGTEGDPGQPWLRSAPPPSGTVKRSRPVLPASRDSAALRRPSNSPDKCFYYVPCPHCAEMQSLVWDRLKWSKSVKGQAASSNPVFYVCVNGCEIKEGAKYDMVRLGEWRATTESYRRQDGAASISTRFIRHGSHGRK